MRRRKVTFTSKEGITTEDSLNWRQKGIIVTIFNKYFNAFLCRERSISGNKLYTFPARIRRVFLKELLGEELSKRDENIKGEWGVR